MTSPQPGWYPDQQQPGLHRWWDGGAWTAHTRPTGPAPQRPHDAVPIELDIERGHDPERIRRQVANGTGSGDAGSGGAGSGGAGSGGAGSSGASRQGGGTLFTEPVLVVNQRAKLIEMSNEFGVFDQNGNQLGAVVQVGQSTLKKMVRLFGEVDQFLTHRFEIRDTGQSTVLKVVRPGKVFKSRFQVARGDDSTIGEIVQENVFGKIRFAFTVNGAKVGGIQAENWRAWNFAVLDEQDTEVARITKTWGGFVRAAFTTADNYVVQIHRPLRDPLASMVVAAALTIDTALKQDTQ